MRGTLSDRTGAALLMAPLLLFLVLAYAWPFLGVVKWSFTLPTPGLDQYSALATDPLVQSVFIRTLRIALIVTLVSVTAAYAITVVWVRGSPVQRVIAEFCILVPFWISVLTRAFGWVALLSNRGLINTWLQSIGFISEPLALVRN
ncbi:MAG: ABC transporter permease, partial [Mesorhizobium sp.]